MFLWGETVKTIRPHKDDEFPRLHFLDVQEVVNVEHQGVSRVAEGW